MKTQIEQTQECGNTPEATNRIQSSEILTNDSYRTFLKSVENIVNFMNSFNQKRLYWVWGSGLIKTIIDAIPEDFFHQLEASLAIMIPDNFTGPLSWILYGLRFVLNLIPFILYGMILLVCYTAATDEKEQIQILTEKLETQWKETKFGVLNDLIWGPANMVCFFFLNAKTGLGMWGDLLTLGLLLFDVSMTIWDYSENEAKYLAEMQRIEDAILIATTQSESDELKIEKRQYTANWEAKQKELLLSLLYAFALVVAFALIIAGTALPPLAIVGTVLCFTFTVLNNSLSVGRELYEINLAEDKLEHKKNSLNGHPSEQYGEELQKLQLDLLYQKDLAFHKTAQLIQVIIVQLLVPPLVLASLVFMPTGIGVAIIVIAGSLAICSSLLVNEFNPGERSSYNPILFAPNKTSMDLEQSAIKKNDCLEYQTI